MKVRCQDCGLIAELKLKKDETIDDYTCDDCSGDLAVFGSEDDQYEPIKCSVCKDEITEDETNTCDECDDDYVCSDCLHEFNCGNICMNCLKDIVKTETKIEYKDKIVEKEVKVYVDKEGIPINTSYNPNVKSRFD